MSRTIELEQAQIAFDDIGEGAPVLLLHGFPATRQLSSQVAPMIAAAGFRVLVPDLAGCGASEAVASESVGMARQARWMFELLDTLGIGRASVAFHAGRLPTRSGRGAVQFSARFGAVVLTSECGINPPAENN